MCIYLFWRVINLFFLKKNFLFIRDNTKCCDNFRSLEWGHPHDNPSHLASSAWIKHDLAEFTFSRLYLTSQPAGFYLVSPPDYTLSIRCKLIIKKSIKKPEGRDPSVSLLLFKNVYNKVHYLLLVIIRYRANRARLKNKYNRCSRHWIFAKADNYVSINNNYCHISKYLEKYMIFFRKKIKNWFGRSSMERNVDKNIRNHHSIT